MPRKSYERQTCKECGAHRAEVGHVTWRGYCLPCGVKRSRAEQNQLRDHSGPWFELWRQRMAASVGAVLVDNNEGT